MPNTGRLISHKMQREEKTMATALITGASTGLGADFARILAAMKYDLILVARNQDRLEELGKSLMANHGISYQTVKCDLGQPGAAVTLCQTIKAQGRSIDILINNAGCGQWGPFATSDAKGLSTMITLNMNALTEITHLCLPDMLARKSGRILNVASTAAFQPGPWMAAYYASKSYVLSLGEALAVELRGTGVSISTLCPGPTKTEFFERAQMGRSRLKNMFFADSHACAQRGITGMMRGQTIIIDGWLNWLLAQSGRIMPRFAVRTVAGMINGSAG
jgi:short-subunit dehydrogenase